MRTMRKQFLVNWLTSGRFSAPKRGEVNKWNKWQPKWRRKLAAKYRNPTSYWTREQRKYLLHVTTLKDNWSDLKYLNPWSRNVLEPGVEPTQAWILSAGKIAPNLSMKYSQLWNSLLYTIQFTPDPSRFRLHRSPKKTKMSVKTARGKVSSVKLVSKWFYSVYV